MEIFQYSFMIRAFIAGIIIAMIAPLIGNFLVIRRYSLIADTLSHIALSGVAIGLIVGVRPIVSTIIITTVASIVLERIRQTRHISGESLLAMFLPGGLALSIVLLSLANGFNSSLFSYLFGSITTVTNQEIGVIVLLGLTTLTTLFFLSKKLLSAAFDEEAARVSGVPVTRVNIILIVLTAITVSLSLQIVGALLVGALMVIPVISAMQLGRSFQQGLFLSILFAFSSMILGLFASYYLNIPAGGAIVLLSLGLFGVSILVGKR